MHRTTVGLAAGTLTGLQLTACSGADGRLQVVSTVAPLTSIVANTVGDRAAVTGVPEVLDVSDVVVEQARYPQ